MDQKIQSSSQAAPDLKLQPELNLELWEPPFDRWLRLTDDLLRDWHMVLDKFSGAPGSGGGVHFLKF